MLSRLLASSRFLILLAVASSLLGAFVVLTYGIVATVVAAVNTLVYPDFGPYGAQKVSVEFIDLIDLFLLGTVLYIFALGLYQLFINPKAPMLPWLHIHSLEHLKEKLLGTVVVLLGVTFLGEVVEWEPGDTSILYLGLAVAPVLLAFVLMLWLAGKDHTPPPEPPAMPMNSEHREH
ncbi:MAG: YqhA family protein [Anaerolineales bacterium]|nr:YqhA family protein [Anaerolineales bacterium]